MKVICPGNTALYILHSLQEENMMPNWQALEQTLKRGLSRVRKNFIQ
jgi:hypothetical protein